MKYIIETYRNLDGHLVFRKEKHGYENTYFAIDEKGQKRGVLKDWIILNQKDIKNVNIKNDVITVKESGPQKRVYRFTRKWNNNGAYDINNIIYAGVGEFLLEYSVVISNIVRSVGGGFKTFKNPTMYSEDIYYKLNNRYLRISIPDIRTGVDFTRTDPQHGLFICEINDIGDIDYIQSKYVNIYTLEETLLYYVKTGGL